MSRLLYVLVLALAIQWAYANVCLPISTNEGTIDVNGLSDVFQVTDGEGVYFVKVCSSFTTFDPSCSALSPSASIGSYWKPNQGVCQIRGKFDGRSALTLIDPANPSKGVTINYEDGETEGISPTSTKLDIVCDTTESAACADGMCKKGSPTGGIQIHIVIKSPKACPSSGRGLLWPVGILGILLILVIIAFIAYWPIGLVVNKFIRKKEGIEIVPNIALWKDLPFLVKDGFLFLFKDIIYDRIIAKIIEFIKSKRGGGGGAAYESA